MEQVNKAGRMLEWAGLIQKGRSLDCGWGLLLIMLKISILFLFEIFDEAAGADGLIIDY